jgi:hypothetical protein
MFNTQITMKYITIQFAPRSKQTLRLRASLRMNSLNVTNEMQLLKTLLLSLLYMFRALLPHHQELTETVGATYSDDMR